MSVLIITILFILGLIFGSFVNALVWRLRQQLDDDGNPRVLSSKQKAKLSIARGRSMCPNCKHELHWIDLVPVLSWLMLKGKCRYCKQSIRKQYPIIELVTALLFVISYVFWPNSLSGPEWFIFAVWLVTLVLLVALAVYDYFWYILPSRLIYVGIAVYAIGLLIASLLLDDIARFGWAFISALVYFALFASVYFASVYARSKKWSSNEWLGYGDVRLAFLLGLFLGYPSLVFVALFFASIIGLLVIMPSYLRHKTSLTSKIPFGPFLIIGCIVTVWWGASIINWYTGAVLGL